ncbi:MAG TPA: response regulator transcription factor [Candidatus Acidoferrales bacterium]|nr:response regulator transcription factor [Candidatus Acidoferrales bacterium]
MNGARGVVLVIEDSAAATGDLAEVLESGGFTVSRTLELERPAAVLLAWRLPDRAGAQACQEVRARDALVPILFICDREAQGGATRILDAGADDFLVRPFRSGDLISRLNAHLRKAEAAGAARARFFVFGGVEVDLEARQARVRGRPLHLGPLEFSLLEYLSLHAGVAVSREQVLREVYGYSGDIDTERVDLLVRRLRGKLGEGPDLGGRIVAVPGFGYRLERRA